MTNKDYKDWIIEVKQKIRSSQNKAAIAVNTALIEFYWDLGKMISDKIEQSNWGNKILENVSKDLKEEFPDMKGFSITNLKYTKLFFEYFKFSPQLGDEIKKVNPLLGFQAEAELHPVNNESDTISPQLEDEILKSIVCQIPWGHIKVIITKIKNLREALFYIQKTKENNWSRDVLALQIKSDLYKRQGGAITNFKTTLPTPNSDLAQQTLKDPYVFDFLQLTEDFKERDIEKQLTERITQFLLELGKGFAFIGRQYYLQLNEKDYYIDLLFYHVPMQCYVVVELKNREFEPEFTGKLNFYLTLIDRTLKRSHENPTIGILLCRGKDNLEVEYALQDIHKPMGVSEFNLSDVLPKELKSKLPTVEELEEELKKIKDKK